MLWWIVFERGDGLCTQVATASRNGFVSWTGEFQNLGS